ncbi:TPA: hypothetical protein ACH3X1_014355 [Trebouxia sp. C0004]
MSRSGRMYINLGLRCPRSFLLSLLLLQANHIVHHVAGQTPEEACPKTYFGNFIDNITASSAVPLDQVKPILNSFLSAVDYNELGQLAGNLSGALQYAALKQSLLAVAKIMQADASNLGYPLRELASSVNFTEVGTVLQAGLYDPFDGAAALHILGQLSNAVNTTVFGTAIQDMSAHVDLRKLGTAMENVLSSFDFASMGVIVASLPKVFDFAEVGTLLGQLVTAVNLPNVGTALNNEVSYIGNVYATFNACTNTH